MPSAFGVFFLNLKYYEYHQTRISLSATILHVGRRIYYRRSLFANTFPMFQKSLIPACIFGLAVSLAVTVAECFKNKGAGE